MPFYLLTKFMKTNNALFSLAFRPFFLAASIFALIAMLAWVAVFLFSVKLSAFAYYPMIIWHAHEMIFGYSMAVIAGFLLTAIKNWTGVQTVNGTKLLVLVGIWILGRIIPFITDIAWLIAAAEMLFLPTLAYFIAVPLIQVGNKRNYFMIGLIIVFGLLNMLIHLELLKILSNVSNYAIQTGLYLIIALIIVMAGRVFPMFSQNGVETRYQVKKYIWVEKLVMPSYFLFMISVIFIESAEVVLISAVIAVIIHGIRLKGWYNQQIWHVPLVWVLHLGYLFLIIGFIMSAINAYNPSFYFLAMHAFSVGVISTITVGMMARVSIGHTGRNLRFPPKTVKYIFSLSLLAAVVRSFVPIFLSNYYEWTVVISGAILALAFLLFVISYTSLLIKPRVDPN